MPGGGANRTVLGAYRMGDQDGNAPGSAIYSGDIFGPIGQPDRVNPARTFENVGNNVFQPPGNDGATIALLKRLGDQQFKATSQAPFEDYRAQQRLARDLDEASRNASLSDLGTSREIIRNLAAQRRQQNEDDYLRKMLDAGATPEAAKKEIEDVRNANALQEARKVEDREYQAKTLISRMAMARGITPMVREPLNQSSSIDNPQRSQAMSQAMGMPGEGFGTSPLDMNRQFMTPDFYKRSLRRSTVSQEASDEASAFSNLLTGAGNEDQLQNLQSGFSMATVRGQERQQQVEMASEALASRLDALRQRQNRIKLPLPKPAVGKDIIDMLYRSKTKVAGNRVLYSPETIHDLNPLQLLVSINFNVQQFENGFQKLTNEVKKYTWGSSERPSDTWLLDLKKVALAMNRREQDVRIPFASASLSVPTSKYIDLLNDIKQGAIPELRRDIEQGRIELMREINTDEIGLAPGPPFVGGGARANTTRSRGRLPAEVAPQLEVLEMAEPPVPGAPNVGGGGAAVAADPYAGKTKTQLKALLREAGLNQGGNVADMKARLRRGTN